MEIKNVGQLRKIIENLSDDYEIEMRVRRKLTDEELKNCRYPYPYINWLIRLRRIQDISYSLLIEKQRKSRELLLYIRLLLVWMDFL